jgi:tRNA uridine 5-carboxymethylaminomethyl modification enzyme
MVAADAPSADELVWEQIEIDAKYSGYLEKEQEQVDKLKRLESVRIPDAFDFSRITALSIEARQKLDRLRPETVGQASRISGVSPSDIQVLLVHLGR